MTWGSHCPQCGDDNCGWVAGTVCEGNSPKPPAGYRVRPCRHDFGLSGFFYYIEKRRRGWFRDKWIEVDGCREDTPAGAIAKLKAQTPFEIRH